jgi:alkanesulfonate monooxygenase SsuD/methylene tetrahydromethanopterin reductase-like flavin-dependent oxidoreductase (luciferase family)
MEFGFGIPTRGPMATPEGVVTLARAGEQLGFSIITVSDHIVIPPVIASTYPYNERGSTAS